MKKKQSGFTIIEVSLFLAITGLLFLGVTIGVQNSIYQQRFNDSVQSFVDFLRNIYAEVMNVQNNNSDTSGKSDNVIYGKLITFNDDDGKNKINAYNVVGRDASDSGTGGVGEMLEALDAKIGENNNSGAFSTYGIVESYSPKWSASIQSTNSYSAIQATVLIVRHPRSGTVHTLVKDGGINVVKPEWTSFKLGDIDFCVNPDGNVENTIRRDVRIENNARNSSGVITVSSDSEDNRCG